MTAAIAYNPKLSLFDSQVAIYKIYVLKHPETKEIFYVGQTMKSIDERLAQHLSQKESNAAKNEYIQSLIGGGSKPIIESIEVIKTTCYADKMAVNERELFWIRYYKELGCNLLNATGTDKNAKCHEYHRYLASIKNGESSYHYYYCGKTRSGVAVYDEERLVADGFSMPQPKPEPVYETVRTTYYNPWTNPRFIHKNGYRSDYYDKYSYVPCYRDEDPNYYDNDY